MLIDNRVRFLIRACVDIVGIIIDYWGIKGSAGKFIKVDVFSLQVPPIRGN